jgi:hypothetical protein
MAEVPEGGIWPILDGLSKTTTTSLFSLTLTQLVRVK